MADTKVGLIKCDLARCYEGYTLYGGVQADGDYLIDMEGQVVHTWPTLDGHLDELRPDGNLLYGEANSGMKELDWEGNTVWSYSVDYHHDFALTPEGRVMILAGARTLLFDRPDLFEGCTEGYPCMPIISWRSILRPLRAPGSGGVTSTSRN